MSDQGLQIQKFIMLSLLAHAIFAGLLSALQITVPFPAERPLRVRLVDQPSPAASRPPLDPRNLGQFSGRAQRPAEKEGPARTPDSSLLPNLKSASPRAAVSTPLPAPLVAPSTPAPRTLTPPSIPPVPPAPSMPADLASPPSTPAPRAAATPSIPPPLRVPAAPASPSGKAVLAQPSVESAGGSREAKATRPQGVPPTPSLEGPAKAVPPGRDGLEGTTGPYDLRGQVAMLWKNLDPRKYPYQDADTGEEGDTGSPTERTVSLDSQDSRFASYLLGVKRRIESFWGYPPEARGLTGNLALTFGITRDGRLSDLQLTDTSGIAPLDNEAIRAIREAAPFAPFPERMRFERLNIRAAFYYYATRAGLRGR